MNLRWIQEILKVKLGLLTFVQKDKSKIWVSSFLMPYWAQELKAQEFNKNLRKIEG